MTKTSGLRLQYLKVKKHMYLTQIDQDNMSYFLRLWSILKHNLQGLMGHMLSANLLSLVRCKLGIVVPNPKLDYRVIQCRIDSLIKLSLVVA